MKWALGSISNECKYDAAVFVRDVGSTVQVRSPLSQANLADDLARHTRSRAPPDIVSSMLIIILRHPGRQTRPVLFDVVAVVITI